MSARARRSSLVGFLSLSLLGGGCGLAPAGTENAGAKPAPALDAGTIDAGSHATDAGRDEIDAGTPPIDAGRDVLDAGAHEAGAHDAGSHDAGMLDAGSEVVDSDAGALDGGADVGAEPFDAGSELDDAGQSVPTGPLTLYVSPTGSDDNDGASAAAAVRTLDRVHAILSALQPDRDVDVLIAPGTYRGQRVTWTYTMPEHTIRFRTSAADNTRPVFDGCLTDDDCPGGTWFVLSASAGEPTNLHFEYLRVTRYQTAISLNGSRASRTTSNGHNRIYGMYIDRIGNGFAPGLAPSTAAVRLVNSDDNLIRNNHFVDVINASSGGLIHAIYAAHGSERNEITRNRFQRSTGDAVRIRDFSNDNVVTNNRFIRVGANAGYTDWYCDHEVNDACTSPNPECPSWGNQFRDNTLDGTWTCQTLRVWQLFQDDETAGCAAPSADARRVRTSGNTQTATPCSLD